MNKLWFKNNEGTRDDEGYEGPLWFNQSGKPYEDFEFEDVDVEAPGPIIAPPLVPAPEVESEKKERRPIPNPKKEKVVRFPLNEIPQGVAEAQRYGYKGTEQDIIHAANQLINSDGTIKNPTHRPICGNGGCIVATCCPTMIDIIIPI